MAQPFEHIPVLRDEVVALFDAVPPGVLVDATVGGAGHAAALLDAYPELRLLGYGPRPGRAGSGRETARSVRRPGVSRPRPLLVSRQISSRP